MRAYGWLSMYLYKTDTKLAPHPLVSLVCVPLPSFFVILFRRISFNNLLCLPATLLIGLMSLFPVCSSQFKGTKTHTCTYTHTNTPTSTYAHSYSHKHTHTHTCTYLLPQTHPHAHMHILTQCSHTHTHVMHIHLYIHTHTCMQTHSHTHIHKHTYTCTHAHTLFLKNTAQLFSLVYCPNLLQWLREYACVGYSKIVIFLASSL